MRYLFENYPNIATVSTKWNTIIWILVGVLFGQLLLFSYNKLFSASITADMKDALLENKESGFCQTDLASLLEQKIRILCLVITTKSYHRTKADSVKETWGQGCAKLMFISDAPDEILPAINVTSFDDWKHLWAKTRTGFQMAYDNYLDDFDWFLKADDDTFVIMENLRALLAQKKPSDPHYVGHPYLWKLPFNIGGAGYVLSRMALIKLVEEAFVMPGKCPSPDSKGEEDIAMATCLNEVGVTTADTRDENQRNRFFQLSLDVLSPKSRHPLYDMSPYKQGPKCCSDLAISFHQIEPHQMYEMYYLVNILHLFGRHICGNLIPDGNEFKSHYNMVTEMLKGNYPLN